MMSRRATMSTVGRAFVARPFDLPLTGQDNQLQMSRVTTLLPVALLSLALSCEDPLGSRVAPLASPDASPGCGPLSLEGCCTGTTLHFCAAGTPTSKACTAPAQCGWSAAFGLYTCGSSSGSDPAGQHPRACSSPDGSADAPADLASVAADQQAPDQASPEQGAQDQGAAADASAADALVGCGPLSFTGCCVKQKLYFCAGGKVLALDCQSNLHCGWNPKGGYYDCGTDGKADPSGKHPRACGGVLGDSGVALDVGAADLASDLPPADSGASDGSTADRLEDLLLDGDSAGAADAPASDLPVDDSGAEGVVGLDAVGLEPSRQDASTPDAESSGCSCTLEGGGGAGWGLLLICLVLGRRRGAGGAGKQKNRSKKNRNDH